ncbi:hypothetical protein NECAME_19149, partial [Necator americanus]
EEDAKKKAQEEEDERKKELELLLARSTSPAFLNGTQGGGDCTCVPKPILPIRDDHEIITNTPDGQGLSSTAEKDSNLQIPPDRRVALARHSSPIHTHDYEDGAKRHYQII